jgi:hypothetical protein
MLGAFPAAAEQAFTPKQCENAIAISTSILDKYKGRISEKLVSSFGRFRDSHCDLATPFTRIEGTADDQAFGEFRLKLIALRTANLSRPQALAKQ